MSKHTEGLLIAGQFSSVVGMPIVGQMGTVICNMSTMPIEHPHHKEINEVAQANAERLTACWNALAGIDDPAAFMRDVRELMIAETSIPINRQIDVICEHLKGGAE